MKNDISIPEVSGLSLFIALEFNDRYKTEDWVVYLLNDKEVDLEMVVIVSKGFDESRSTSITRKKISLLPKKSLAKIELIQPELFELNNQYQITFFEDNQLFEKTFIIPQNSILKDKLVNFESFGKHGILIQ